MILHVFRYRALPLIIYTTLVQSLLCGQDYLTGSFTDPRDGQMYTTVKIGNRWWMAQNLNYATETGSWCLDDDSTGTQFGRFYNWEVAKKAVPGGWHLPSKQEFEDMLSSLGTNVLPNWGELYHKLIDGGDSGFNFLLTGSYQEAYGRRGSTAFYWSSDLWWFSSLIRIMVNPWRLSIRKNGSYVNIGHGAESHYGFNVRCVKDE